MTVLSQAELSECSGGFWGHVLTYMAVVDLAYDFGSGFGDGLYNGMHQHQSQ
ncbi:hypothetical protein KUL17_33460 [Alteromonas sp. KUL17]|uniref:hypothetical protein n=1 Tax=Alteromonas sp. KUL17 TaxID=2480796 RepID=UPI0010FFBD0A|nr:hypothetical protein [Alteromonas sp. KUL17]GEA04449.1 hypothetical protein KUL17_33460 [Alteromonas sp. KUL17]